MQEFLFYRPPKGIIDTLELKNRLESLFKATLWLSVSTEAGEKTKWVVRCRRNGREISVNYRVEPFRGWDECEVFVTRHRSRLLFLVLNINNPAPSFATPSFVPPSPPPPSPLPPPRLTSVVSRHPMNCAADNAAHYADWLISSPSPLRKINCPAIGVNKDQLADFADRGTIIFFSFFLFIEGKHTFSSYFFYIISGNICSVKDKRSMTVLLRLLCHDVSEKLKDGSMIGTAVSPFHVDQSISSYLVLSAVGPSMAVPFPRKTFRYSKSGNSLFMAGSENLERYWKRLRRG